MAEVHDFHERTHFIYHPLIFSNTSPIINSNTVMWFHQFLLKLNPTCNLQQFSSTIGSYRTFLGFLVVFWDFQGRKYTEFGSTWSRHTHVNQGNSSQVDDSPHLSCRTPPHTTCFSNLRVFQDFEGLPTLSTSDLVHLLGSFIFNPWIFQERNSLFWVYISQYVNQVEVIVSIWPFINYAGNKTDCRYCKISALLTRMLR